MLIIRTSDYEIVNVTLPSFAAVTSAREGRQIALEKEYGELCIH